MNTTDLYPFLLGLATGGAATTWGLSWAALRRPRAAAARREEVEQ